MGRTWGWRVLALRIISSCERPGINTRTRGSMFSRATRRSGHSPKNWARRGPVISTKNPRKSWTALSTPRPCGSRSVEALKNLERGGRLVVNAIRKEEVDKDYLLRLDYARHLWLEKEIKSVANVARRDVQEFLELAARIPIKPEIQEFALEEANRALVELKAGGIRGAKVLRMD